jgi:hypothetical protein
MKLEQAHYKVSKDPLDDIFTEHLSLPLIKEPLKAALLGKLEDCAVVFPAIIEKFVNLAHNEGMIHCLPVGHTSSCWDSRLRGSPLDPLLYFHRKLSLISDPSNFVDDSEISLAQLEIIGHSDIVCLRTAVASIVLFVHLFNN